MHVVWFFIQLSMTLKYSNLLKMCLLIEITCHCLFQLRRTLTIFSSSMLLLSSCVWPLLCFVFAQFFLQFDYFRWTSVYVEFHKYLSQTWVLYDLCIFWDILWYVLSFFYRDFPSFVFRSTTIKYVRPTNENF